MNAEERKISENTLIDLRPYIDVKDHGVVLIILKQARERYHKAKMAEDIEIDLSNLDEQANTDAFDRVGERVDKTNMEGAWISVEERLPKDSQEIWTSDGDKVWHEITYVYGGFHSDMQSDIPIKYWKPLEIPKAPNK